MKFEKQKMVGWFDVGQLVQTGLKTVVSSIFGNYADKREVQAALPIGTPAKPYYDCTGGGGADRWVDYISDLGDGFDATYTLAHLLARPALEVDYHGQKHSLPRGKVLVLGGDEVYPTPELDEYNNRFKGPYKAAFPDQYDDPSLTPDPDDRSLDRKFATPQFQNSPWLFAVPGNHDWYDGLTNFMKVFAQERRIGNWQTVQERSYFAIKLTADCWLWGIDVQLDSDIDFPQRKYFELIASEHMANHSRVILCTAEPVWVYKAMQKKNRSYERLQFFVRNYIDNERGWLGPQETVRHHLAATLTGDLHHYSHYCRQEGDRTADHLITAGGGGAFLHPTHNLPHQLDGLTPGQPPLERQAVFPDAATSSRLLLGNWLFPFQSPYFWGALGVLYALFAWFALAHTYEHQDSVVPFFATLDQPFWSWLGLVVGEWAFNPLILGFMGLLLWGIYKFTDTNGSRRSVGWLGVGHGLAHLAAIFLALWLLGRLHLGLFQPEAATTRLATLAHHLLFAAQVAVVGGFIGAMVMGAYLYLANRLFDIHLTESFSGMAIADYKNLLRIHVEKDKITIYPIGIAKVGRDWEQVGQDPAKPRFKDQPIGLELIEDPIVVWRQ
jgi:hypothetical protein